MKIYLIFDCHNKAWISFIWFLLHIKTLLLSFCVCFILQFLDHDKCFSGKHIKKAKISTNKLDIWLVLLTLCNNIEWMEKKRTHLILLPKERNIENMKDLLHLQQKLNFAKDEWQITRSLPKKPKPTEYVLLVFVISSNEIHTCTHAYTFYVIFLICSVVRIPTIQMATTIIYLLILQMKHTSAPSTPSTHTK